jgi:hypothetical protein
VKKLKKPKKKVNPSKPLNGETLQAAVTWAIGEKVFAGLKIHGNTVWRMTELVVLAVVWVWSDQKTLTGAFREANQWTIDLLGQSVLGTFQGMMGALTTWTALILPLLRVRLHQLMLDEGQEHFRVGCWVPIAVDGSRLSVPRTRANEESFCSKTYGQSGKAKRRRKKRQKKDQRLRVRRKPAAPQGPQIWTTLLWHMGLHMPWSWRNGSSDASERQHFKDVLATELFPENTLFCADAGFVGYELWKQIIEVGQSFLIRAGANVKLLKGLGYVRESNGIVYLWPDKSARQNQPPLVLRLIRVQIGKAKVALLTNVLDTKRLSEARALRLYRMRWGIELQFRTLKQTFGRRTLRSRTPERALVELDWSLMGLWLIQLFAIKEQIDLGKLPEHCSVGLAINIVRETFDRWWDQPPSGTEMASRLGEAVKDSYVRTKPKRGRYKPQNGSEPSCGQPIILKATAEHKARLKRHLAMAA